MMLRCNHNVCNMCCVCLLVNTTGAGDGPLTVQVSYRDAFIPAEVVRASSELYRVSFQPRGPGLYYIHVHFAGVEIDGNIVQSTLYLPSCVQSTYNQIYRECMTDHMGCRYQVVNYLSTRRQPY